MHVPKQQTTPLALSHPGLKLVHTLSDTSNFVLVASLAFWSLGWNYGWIELQITVASGLASGLFYGSLSSLASWILFAIDSAYVQDNSLGCTEET